LDLKWTDGKPFERSKRPSREEYEVIQDEIKSNEIEKSAYTSSLNHDENTWDLLNQGLNGGFKLSSKRETIDDKMSDRELIQQIGFNPFLGEANYVHDIEVSNKFLKPINTTEEREKNRKKDNENN
jgi:hypothetical protein